MWPILRRFPRRPGLQSDASSISGVIVHAGIKDWRAPTCPTAASTTMRYLILVALIGTTSVSLADRETDCREYRYARAVDSQTAAAADGPGFFLEVRRGEAPPSYVLGTLHSAHPDVIAKWGRTVLFPPAIPIRMLVTERVGDTQTAGDPRFLQTGKTLSNILRGERRLYDAIVRALEGNGLDSALVDSLKPWYLVALLQQASVQQFPTSALTLDQYLGEQVSRLGVDSRGLETLSDLASLYDTQFSHSERVRLLWEGVCNDDINRAAIDAQTAAYVTNDVAGLYAIMTRHVSRNDALTRKMNDVFVRQRNRRFWAVLEPEIAAGGAFVVIGNLHLYGDEGLMSSLARLSDERISIRAIDPDDFAFLLEPADIEGLLDWVLKYSAQYPQWSATRADLDGLRVRPRSIIRLREVLCPGQRCSIDATYGLEKNTIDVADGVFARLMHSSETPRFRIDGATIVKRGKPQRTAAGHTDVYAESILVRELARHLIYRSRHAELAGPNVPRVRPTPGLSPQALEMACIDSRVLYEASTAQQAYLRDKGSDRAAHLFALSPLCRRDVD